NARHGYRAGLVADPGGTAGPVRRAPQPPGLAGGGRLPRRSATPARPGPPAVVNAAGSTPARTIVGMSGGVDSSVAALLLQQAGEPIAGLFMQNWADDGSGDCRAED